MRERQPFSISTILFGPTGFWGNNNNDKELLELCEEDSDDDLYPCDPIAKLLESIHLYTVMISNCFLSYYIVCLTQYIPSLTSYLIYTPKMTQLPESLFTAMCILPLYFYMAINSLTFVQVLFALILYISCNTSLCIMFKLVDSLPLIVINLVFCLAAISEYHRQCWKAFVTNQQLAEVNQHNMRLAEEIKAAELKHAIGNVVHDLKTPLTSFISAMEVIALLSKEILVQFLPTLTALATSSMKGISGSGTMSLPSFVSSGNPSPPSCVVTSIGGGKSSTSELLDENSSKINGELNIPYPLLISSIEHNLRKNVELIVDIADNTTITNAFLMMTINRVVDYTRSTFGVPLQGKMETFQLRDVVQLVIECCSHNHHYASSSSSGSHGSTSESSGESSANSSDKSVTNGVPQRDPMSVSHTQRLGSVDIASPKSRKAAVITRLLSKESDDELDVDLEISEDSDPTLFISPSISASKHLTSSSISKKIPELLLPGSFRASLASPSQRGLASSS